MTDNYKVGYGRPPSHTRFQKGQSGNPKGRPRGSRNRDPTGETLKSILQTELKRPVTVRDGNQTMTISMAEAILRALTVSAGRGNVRAQKLVLELGARFEKEDSDKLRVFFKDLVDYKMQASRAIARCEAAGEAPPDIYPLPDNINIDVSSNTVTVTGPFSAEENDQICSARRMEQLIRVRIAETMKTLSRTRSAEKRIELEQSLNASHRVLEKARKHQEPVTRTWKLD